MRHRTGPTLVEYAFMLFIAVFAVSVLAYALWPMVQMILDGFQILSQAFNGTFVPTK